MENTEDFSTSRLELCSYRYLQQLAKTMGLPSNVKKVYLIEMIHAKKCRSAEELNAIVFRIKEERKNLAKPRKPMTRKAKRVQGTEISSTSNGSPPVSDTPQPSNYIITCPESPLNCQTLLKHYPPSILHPNGNKNKNCDRVLRSFHNRLRPNYSVLNVSNSVIGAIKAQNALQRSQEMQNRHYKMSLEFEQHRQMNFGESVMQKVKSYVGKPRQICYNDYPVKRKQPNLEELDEDERQPVPVPKSSNICPQLAKRQRKVSGIYPLDALGESSYQYIPSVTFRHEDGHISKINAFVQKPTQRNNNQEVVNSKTTQTYFVGRNAMPNSGSSTTVKVVPKNPITLSVQDVVNYEIDHTISNSSTETAEESSIEREETKYRRTYAAKRTVRYAESTSHTPEQASRCTESRSFFDALGIPEEYSASACATDNLVEYIDRANRASDNSNMHTKTTDTSTDLYRYRAGTSRTIKNTRHAAKSYTIENPDRTKTPFTETRNAYTENRSCTTDLNSYIDIRRHTVDDLTKSAVHNNLATKNLHRYIEDKVDKNIVTKKRKRYTEKHHASSDLNRYTEKSFRAVDIDSYINKTCSTKYVNKNMENGHAVGNSNGNKDIEERSCDIESAGSKSYSAENLKRGIESRNYTETPNRYMEGKNYAPDRSTVIVNYPTDVENICTEARIGTDVQEATPNKETDYPNMSALTDIYPENHVTKLSSNNPNNCTVYYHKTIKADQVRSQRMSATEQQQRSDGKLPKISDVFSRFCDVQNKTLSQPIYVQVSEESERIPPSLNNSSVIEYLYNYKNQFLSGTNEPLLKIFTSTNSTQCVYSTSTIATAIAHPSEAVCSDFETHPYQRDSQQYVIKTDTVSGLHDYLQIAELERGNFKGYEAQISDSSYGAATSQLGANVTIPEMVEDAFELISQDGDYMERIGLDVRMQCILCEWAGPKIFMENHIKQDHPGSITDREEASWCVIFRLGSLTAPGAYSCELSAHCARTYVLAARYADDNSLLVAMTVLPTIMEEMPKCCRLTVYNKVTGEPNTWEGEIANLPDNMPYETHETNGLKLDITSLDLLPNSANLKLVNGELVISSTSKVVVGQPELNDIEIAVYVQIFD